MLRTLELFSHLSEEELERLAGSHPPRHYPAGHLLFSEGDSGSTFFIIIRGEIEIIKALGTPEERLLNMVQPGNFLGEMALLNPESRRSAAARTHTTVEVMELTQNSFEMLLSRQPHIALELLREMSNRLRHSGDATIRDLQEKNRRLAQAYDDLKNAQKRLIEQEKLAHELAIARQIQSGLLPKHMPQIPGRETRTHWKPANDVGGDFYDFLKFPDGRIGLVIGDVSGKGVPASLVMAITRSVLRPAAEQLITPGDVLERVNNLLYPEMPKNMFVTCQYALFNPAENAIEIANAGHFLPFLCSTADVLELRVTGLPLGLMPDMQYEQIHFEIGPDQAFLMYSDGICEAHNEEGEMFSVKGMKDVLKTQLAGPGAGPVDLIPLLLESLEAFTGPDWEQEDDVTLLSLEPAGLVEITPPAITPFRR